MSFTRDILRGFRDFIMRGNVVDLAVGVVIGVAFSDLVSNFTESMVQPLIALMGGGGELSGSWVLNGQEFKWASVINGFITFLITAAVLYFLVVLPMNKFSALFKKREAEMAADISAEVKLLTEIRDALVRGDRATVLPRQPVD
jgi:large conductance mechanosensitive channel